MPATIQHHSRAVSIFSAWRHGATVSPPDYVQVPCGEPEVEDKLQSPVLPAYAPSRSKSISPFALAVFACAALFGFGFGWRNPVSVTGISMPAPFVEVIMQTEPLSDVKSQIQQSARASRLRRRHLGLPDRSHGSIRKRGCVSPSGSVSSSASSTATGTATVVKAAKLASTSTASKSTSSTSSSTIVSISTSVRKDAEATSISSSATPSTTSTSSVAKSTSTKPTSTVAKSTSTSSSASATASAVKANVVSKAVSDVVANLADGSSIVSGSISSDWSYQLSGPTTTGGCLEAAGIDDCYHLHLDASGNLQAPGDDRQRNEFLSPPADAGTSWKFTWKYFLTSETTTTSTFFHLSQLISRNGISGPTMFLDAVNGMVTIQDVTNGASSDAIPMSSFTGITTQHSLAVTYGSGGSVSYKITNADTGDTILSYSASGNFGDQSSVKFGMYREIGGLSAADAYLGDMTVSQT